jgi:hypothetical protein
MDENTNSPMTNDSLPTLPSDEDLERSAATVDVAAAISFSGAPTVSIFMACCSNNGTSRYPEIDAET